MARALIAATAVLVALLPGGAAAQILGDAGACSLGTGPAIEATIEGLKDRRGELKLELYPATEADFLKDDRDLVAEGKPFRRVRVPTPQSGTPILCIRVPRPGSWALLFTHNRDGKNKFGFWSDGAGFVSKEKLGRSRPKVGQATIAVGGGVTRVTIRAQYLRGLSGFRPVKPG